MIFVSTVLSSLPLSCLRITRVTNTYPSQEDSPGNPLENHTTKSNKSRQYTLPTTCKASILEASRRDSDQVRSLGSGSLGGGQGDRLLHCDVPPCLADEFRPSVLAGHAWHRTFRTSSAVIAVHRKRVTTKSLGGVAATLHSWKGLETQSQTKGAA
eukprot:2181957-Amphidinium_carterae.1